MLYLSILEPKFTCVLTNLLEMNYPEAFRAIFIIPIDETDNINENKKMFSSFYNKPEYFYYESSLRGSLKKGKYKIVLLLYSPREDTSAADFLENGGDQILFRLAASKHCTVTQPAQKNCKAIQLKLKSYLY